MSIKHALLALLAEEPTHGYELKKRFDDALGALWPLQQAQIYNNLRLMVKANLIEVDEHVVQEGVPDRKEYRLTTEGRAELDRWTRSPVRSQRKLKDDFYLKLSTLINVLDRPDIVTDLLWQQRESHLQQLRELEHALTDAERRDDMVTAALLEGAILHAEADLNWLDRVEERLIAAFPAAGSGGHA